MKNCTTGSKAINTPYRIKSIEYRVQRKELLLPHIEYRGGVFLLL